MAKMPDDKQKHRPRDETRRLIVALVRHSKTALTRTEIARALKRAKTPHLNALIDELVVEGYLQRMVWTFHNGVQGYVYFVQVEGDE